MSQLDDHTYTRFCSKQNLSKSLNTLSGILSGIKIDGVINRREIEELNNWCSDHEPRIKSNPFNELIPLIREASSDGVIDKEELTDIRWFLNQALGENEFYDGVTSSLQILQGIMHGILADDHVNDEEVKALSEWIDQHEFLSGCYPYDELNSLLLEILKDGIISTEERALLTAFLSDFANLSSKKQDERIKEIPRIHGLCSATPEIVFEERLFCFTGMSARCKRSEMVEAVESVGGSFTRSPNKKLNYLIYGAAGNQCWAFSCYGRKVEQVVKMRKEGLPIVIVHENDFWDAYEDYK